MIKLIPIVFLMAATAFARGGKNQRLRPETRQTLHVLCENALGFDERDAGSKVSRPKDAEAVGSERLDAARRDILKIFRGEKDVLTPEARIARMSRYFRSRAKLPKLAEGAEEELREIKRQYYEKKEEPNWRCFPPGKPSLARERYHGWCVAGADFREKGRGRRIAFLGTDHVGGKRPRAENKSMAANYDAIDRYFERLDPAKSAVVMEAMKTDWGVSPCHLALMALMLTRAEAEAAGEAVYTVLEAVERGVPFVGGEPMPEAIAEELGITEREKALRAVAAGFRYRLSHGRDPELARALKEKRPGVLARVKKIFNDSKRGAKFSWKEFIDWYYEGAAWGKMERGGEAGFDEKEEALLERLSVTGLRKYGTLHMDSAPFRPCRGGTSPMRMAGIRANYPRNHNLYRLLRVGLKDVPDVLVVYGKGHMEELEPLLQERFGPAVFDESLKISCKPPRRKRPGKGVR